jgi:hypothetical protein
MQNIAYDSGGTTDGERRFDMAATTLFTCLCGRQKQTSNHWVLARITSNGITFMPWDWNLAMNSDIIVLCGEGCASALFSRSLGEWKRPVQNITQSITVTEPELAVA